MLRSLKHSSVIKLERRTETSTRYATSTSTISVGRSLSRRDTSGVWQPLHRVLVSPIAFRDVGRWGDAFHLALTQYKLKHSPGARGPNA